MRDMQDFNATNVLANNTTNTNGSVTSKSATQCLKGACVRNVNKVKVGLSQEFLSSHSCLLTGLWTRALGKGSEVVLEVAAELIHGVSSTVATYVFQL